MSVPAENASQEDPLEMREPLYEAEEPDFDFLDTLAQAEEQAENLEPGALLARALEEQKNVLRALQKAQEDLGRELDEGREPDIRREMAQIAQSRHIQNDDPLWVLVELYALLHDRTNLRMRRLVSAALQVGSGRIRLDQRILELLPLINDAALTVEASTKLLREEVGGIGRSLTQHRADAVEFCEGMGEVFRSFKAAAESVVTAAQQNRWERLAERVLIPLLAFALGALTVRMMAAT